jgi:hypothetical protein
MEEYERKFLQAVAGNLAASIATGMRSTADEDLFEDETTLTPAGRMWARGYLTGRLSVVRSGATGNPNLSADDLEAVAALIDQNESDIAAQLYG